VRRCVVASLLAGAVLACGSSSPTSPSASASTAAAVAAPTGMLRVATFNIQHGLSNDGAYSLDYAIRTIAALNPDIIGVQELTRNHPSYHCEDQPARIAQGLSAATGRTWSYIYKQEWTTQVTDCKGDTPETEGNGLFAPFPISQSGSVDMWNGRNAIKTTLKIGPGINLMTTHLQSGLLPQNSSDRIRQLGTLLPWSQNQGSVRILVCDCNANPTTPEYGQLRAIYHDAWQDAVAAGIAKGRMDGITHKSSRIDYVWYEPGGALELTSYENVETPALIGIEASDHRPQVAIFRIR
jgi:endonuclease/exonuclease/phosphatase family metal-dependent hydrolase